ncbi:MAG: DUF1553 domain-containing protein [Planctomycetaceae bacterium]|nr:DUF1553 domain-containing protein [Planctomycetaceae bacterium]
MKSSQSENNIFGNDPNRDEVVRLTSLLLESQLDDHGQKSLSNLLHAGDEYVELYASLMYVHGQLMWGAAWSVGDAVEGPESEIEEPIVRAADANPNPVASRRRPVRTIAAALSLAVVLIGSWALFSSVTHHGPAIIAINNGGRLGTEPGASKPGTSDPTHATAVVATDGQPSGDRGRNSSSNSDNTTSALVADSKSDTNTDPDSHELSPLRLNGLKPEAMTSSEVAATSERDGSSVVASVSGDHSLRDGFRDNEVVEKIDALLTASWNENGIQPSAMADDYEWVRRAYLTIVGRIPTVEEVQSFVGRPRNRAALLDELVASDGAASYRAVIWSNLLVGRTEHPGVNRDSLFDFLLNEFRRNEPWMETVGRLITASGRNDQNGATNFLLAHLNNDATPATAVMARLFLGEQISCVQCHDHPFARELKQQEYWALNAFLKDTDRVSAPLAMTEGGNGLAGAAWKLVDRRREQRMTFYENRSGQQLAVLPAFDGHVIPEDSSAVRRQELARLLAADSRHRVARAMVNRTWARFFGYGFTNPVDDLGPHAVVSHPELLELLTEAFVKTGYDSRRLMLWIAHCDAWQKTSEVTTANASDEPEIGQVPQFSRVYVRRMTPEQVYESIRVAIRSVADQPVDDSAVASDHRRAWVCQFAHSYDTDENDEAIDFDGTLAQAMVMMNDQEVDKGIRQATDALVKSGARALPAPAETLNRMAVALLSRQPTEGEERVFRSHYRRLSQQTSPQQAIPVVVEDMMWAYLNSSEFVLVH